jgi:hypothetical protein
VLTEDESALLDSFIETTVKESHLKPLMREQLEHSLSVGTGAAIYGVKAGKPTIETVKAQWCTPELDPNTGDVLSLEISYPYIVDTFDSARGKWVETCWLYRRRIDAVVRHVFAPVPAPKDPTQPITWVAAA